MHGATVKIFLYILSVHLILSLMHSCMLHEGHTYVHAKILYQFRLD